MQCQRFSYAVWPGKSGPWSQGGFSSIIWVGTCHWDMKSRPIFIPNFAKNGTHLHTRATNFNQNFWKNSHYFFKLLSFGANFGLNWWNCAYLCADFRKFWKYDPSLYQFLQQIRGHRYTRRLILRPISVARPRIDFSAKNTPPPWPWWVSCVSSYILFWKRIVYL